MMKRPKPPQSPPARVFSNKLFGFLVEGKKEQEKSRLKPHEILQHLGFDIPDEGIDINPHDLYLHSQFLKALGETIAIDSISDERLREIRQGVYALHPEHNTLETGVSLEKLKVLIKSNLSVLYKKKSV